MFSDIDECLSKPCKNDAKCIDEVNNYKCECKPGYSGKDCGTGKISDQIGSLLWVFKSQIPFHSQRSSLMSRDIIDVT